MFNTGTTLKKVRKHKNLTLDQLASRSGIDRGTINRIELGHVSPRIDTIACLCEALGTNLAQFFCQAPEESDAAHGGTELGVNGHDRAIHRATALPVSQPSAPDDYWPVPMAVWQGLVEAVARFEAMLSNSNELIFVLDERGTILYTSPSTENILARRRNEIQGRSILDLCPPDERERLATALLRPDVRSAARPQTLSFSLLTPRDAWVALDCTITSYLQTPSVRALVLNGTPVLG